MRVIDVTKDATMSDTDLPEESGAGRESERSTTPAPRTRASKGGGGGPIQFVRDVQLEMKRVSWPSRSEVVSTTIICLIAVLFFGLYLWGVDSLLSLFFNTLEGWLK
jgi:preprotein translocase subunit SecE